jgi:hypothetical protein
MGLNPACSTRIISILQEIQRLFLEESQTLESILETVVAAIEDTSFFTESGGRRDEIYITTALPEYVVMIELKAFEMEDSCIHVIHFEGGMAIVNRYPILITILTNRHLPVRQHHKRKRDRYDDDKTGQPEINDVKRIAMMIA